MIFFLLIIRAANVSIFYKLKKYTWIFILLISKKILCGRLEFYNYFIKIDYNSDAIYETKSSPDNRDEEQLIE